MTNGGFSKTRLRRMRDIMAGFVARGEVPGLVSLVSRHGDTHVEATGTTARGTSATMARDTLFRIASLTKPVTAVAAMILVEQCHLRLDDPVDRWLPELANPNVLEQINGPLDDVVPARRAITLRDLLTMRMGLGYPMCDTSGWPIQRALDLQQLLQGPPHPQQMPPADEWMRRVGSVPLMSQPGERWMYDLSMDVLGVLIERVADQSLDTFFAEQIFAPLGMKDTSFWVPAEKISRLATSYAANSATEVDAIYDRAADGEWSRPHPFRAGASGLVSTVDDFLAFAQMLLNFGEHGDVRLLSRPTVETMLTDQLTAANRVGMDVFFGDNRSWGLGLSVFHGRDGIASPGRFGWDGGLGTSWYSDPKEDLTGILLTQQSWTSPRAPAVVNDFWTAAYQAIAD